MEAKVEGMHRYKIQEPLNPTAETLNPGTPKTLEPLNPSLPCLGFRAFGVLDLSLLGWDVPHGLGGHTLHILSLRPVPYFGVNLGFRV